MRCPFCAAPDTKVIDSRDAAEGEQIRRRRECLNCRERFTTYETVELVLPRVRKRDGTRETFDENKLRGSLAIALKKRPVATEQIEAALQRILHRVQATGEREVSSRQLGDWVMAELRDLDEVAYVRFASVYRRFEDVRAFQDEIQRLEAEPSAELRRHQIPLLPES